MDAYSGHFVDSAKSHIRRDCRSGPALTTHRHAHCNFVMPDLSSVMPDLLGHLLCDSRVERNVRCHIAPKWINCFDKLILPSPFEVFKLLFAGYGLLNVRKCLEVNELLTVVLLSERRACPSVCSPKRRFKLSVTPMYSTLSVALVYPVWPINLTFSHIRRDFRRVRN